jgi:hypothetical protein
VAQFLTSTSKSDGAFAVFRDYVTRNQGQFADLRNGLLRAEDNPAAAVGFINERDGKLEFLFLNEQFEAAAGGQAAVLKQDLHARGLLRPTGAGSQGSRYVAKRRLVEGSDRHSVVAVSADILND